MEQAFHVSLAMVGWSLVQQSSRISWPLHPKKQPVVATHTSSTPTSLIARHLPLAPSPHLTTSPLRPRTPAQFFGKMPELPSEPEPAAAAKTTWTASGVLALDDAELARYMRQHRGPNGGFAINDMEGWHLLPDDQRNQLAQRLRYCISPQLYVFCLPPCIHKSKQS